MMRRCRYILKIWTMALLLMAGGAANSAWGQVTYYILTKPFSVKNSDNSTYKWTDIRLEALRCTSTGTTVYLPAEFRSPLAKNFKYWKTPTVTANTKLYDDTGTMPKVLQTKYDIYTAVADEMTEGSTLASNGNPTAIYVTYDYDETNTILKLDGAHKYNIQMNSGDNLRYLCFNKNRNNRPAAAKASTVSADDLISDDFVQNINGIGNNTTVDLHFQFYLCGLDPYNITIMTAYEGNGTFMEKLAVEGTSYKKPYAGATIFAKLQNNNNNDGTANMWLSPDAHKHYKSTTDTTIYDAWEGFYKSDMNPIFNAVAVLPKGTGYIFVASKLNQNNTVYQPNGSGNYAVLSDDGNNPRMIFKPLDNAIPMDPDPVTTYTYIVTTPFGNQVSATAEWSDSYMDAEIDDAHVPASLKRKYCSIVGYYKDAALTQKITTYSQTVNSEIYVKYEVTGAPFSALSPSANFKTAIWYELTDAGSNQASGKKLRWDGSSNFKNNGAAEVYEKASEFAFVGDPYELRVLYRDATESNSGERYVGAATVSAGTALTFSSTAGDGYKWEIPADETVGSFELRQYGSVASPFYWQWITGSTSNVTINSSSTRVKVMELPRYTYIYNVVDLAGNIAIKGTADTTIFSNLAGYASIPAVIRSPFLADERITFYDSYTDRNGDTKINRLDWHNDTGGASEQAPITQTPGTNNANIYVAYTTTHLKDKSINLIYSQEFNVKLNGEYLYWNESDNKVLSKSLSEDAAELATTPYLWHLRGRDPYCMRVDNRGYSEHELLSTVDVNIFDTVGNGTFHLENVNNGMFVRVDGGEWGDNKELKFANNRDLASCFVTMLSNEGGVYEVMAASGNTNYYHIGRASIAGEEAKIYSVSTYAHGADQLRFELAGTTLISYHLIDKSGNEIFKDEISSKNPRMTLPAAYVSPLVEEYYYYPTRAKASTDLPGDRISEISDDTNESGGAADHHVYVTYKVSGSIGFGTDYPYMLKFYNGASYHMENGADKLTTGDKIKAVYPYCNGDGNLNIYGQEMNDEQMAGGANTRPRWVWYFESATNDPYHVKIRSKSTISFNGNPNSTYLQTYAVHFDQETDAPRKQRIVTGVNFPGISGKAATEYAILGTANRYKLLTIDSIAADLDGDGSIGAGEKARQYVTSFEQYWKTYNMVRQCILGDARVDKNNPDAFNDPIIMPSERWAELKTKLAAKGVDDAANRVDGCSWHSYEAIANATRWNGYSDLEGADGYEKKKVERLQHWFQTFDMGDGTFEIENAHIPSVLVLLDRHGWEIMRKPIPTGSGDAEAAAKLAVLRAYNSPMVKEYKFYSNATKESGCHKFTLRMQNGAERDQIKVNGKQFTSSSLATLPTYVADRDLYVTYNVKEEYDKSYNTSTHTPSKFIVLQNHEYASDGGTSSIVKTTAPASISSEIIADADRAEGSKTFKLNTLWYVFPNESIDVEMGYPGDVSALSHDNDGFDPYNIQFKNVATGKFFTIDMTKSILSGGQYNGDYTGGTTNVTLADSTTSPVSSPESYDHSTLKMTNQTFMAVQDRNGNLQIMPRFDHNTRIETFATLEEPKLHTKAGVDDATPGEQTTFMVLPVVYDYRIVDGKGRIAMRYKTGGEFYPSMPEHFKSPLAHDFRYYKTLEESEEEGIDYNLTTLADEITSSFAAAGINNSANIYIRYTYNDNYDTDHDNILQGKWLTMKLNNLDVQASGTINTTDSTGVSLYGTTKPADAATLKTSREWHWKFLAAPMDPESEYYIEPDPYAIEIYNRKANYAATLDSPSPMGTPIKIGTASRFVILSNGEDYALAQADADVDKFYFLNGNGMTTPGAGTPKAATMVEEVEFSTTSSTISEAAKIHFSSDIEHSFTYHVITNAKAKAATASPTDDEYSMYGFTPYLPSSIRSPLIGVYDYLYYGNATNESEVYTVSDLTLVKTLYGLYDDVVYVRYPAFDRDKTPYLVPNKKGSSGGHVARHAESNDVTIDITGHMPYNIIWYNDNMMQSTNNSTISDGGSQDLTGTAQYVWYFGNSDPYDIQIKKADDVYVNATGALSATPQGFMLLEKDGYDYGVFAETGNQTYLLNFAGSPHIVSIAESDPNKFVIFALSTHKLVYHLVIDSTNLYSVIPYRETEAEQEYAHKATWEATDTIHIKGTSQRDLKSRNAGGGLHYDGEKYQLGHTYMGQTYCVDAGQVSIGDELYVPRQLERANCQYYYYIDNIQTKAADPSTYQKTAADFSAMETAAASLSAGAYYYYNVGGGTSYYRAYKGDSGAVIDTCTAVDYNNAWQDNATLNNKYKGLKVTKLMSDTELIGSIVRVNVTYAFDTGLETNAGDGFVTSIDHLWYTFETKDGPYLAHYTNAWGLQAMEGRDTRYTNDYLWSPLGDVYGFKMYNRYVYKTSNETTRVMTTEDFTEGRTLKMAVPGSTIVNEESQSVTATVGNEVYELLATESTTPGYFLIHPVINNSGTQYYIRRNTADGIRKNYAILSTTPTEWTFGLTEDLMKPYYDRAGYVGGLNAKGKAAYEAAGNLMDKQEIVYADSNIVQYRPGYYRMHNQPNVSGLTTPRYASGYLHDIEKTAGTSDTPIPMHFYSRKGISTTFEDEGGLGTGFTETAATRGSIPVPATEYDPSTIFYFFGPAVDAPNLPTSKISTQGLYIKGVQADENHGDAVMTATEGDATLFTIMDIGGAVFLIHDGDPPATRKYLHFSQEYEVSSVNMIYDLKYFHNSPTDDAKWCLEPANNQGLMVETHDAGDGYFYSTFCAPFDVAVPIDVGTNNYYAYVCTAWDDEIIHPKRTPASGIYAEGEFVPAGTPVILRTTDNSGSMKLTLPTNAPTTPAATCVFSGVYLEQLLDPVSSNDMVYAFGLPITGYSGVTYGGGDDNGVITGLVDGVRADRGVGFYINATPNKENHEERGQWIPNNRYVQHNKIYYRAGSSGARAPKHNSGVEFVPVIFEGDEQQPEGKNPIIASDGVYDILGRKVASDAEAKDGSWQHRLAPGIYIVNGQKIYIH